jgi:hypothetical protein
MGTGAAGLDDLEVFLEMLVGRGNFYPLRNIQRAEDLDQHISEYMQKRHNETVILYIRLATTIDFTKVQAKLAPYASNQSVHLVFSMNPVVAWNLVYKNPSRIPRLENGDTLMSLEPWHKAALRYWLDNTLVDAIGHGLLDELDANLHNWPALLYEFADQARQNPAHAHDLLLAFTTELYNSKKQSRYLSLFGLDQPDLQLPVQILRLLANHQGPMQLEKLKNDAVEKLGLSQDTSLVKSTLKWAEYMRLAVMVGGREEAALWRIDPLVGHLLTEN